LGIDLIIEPFEIDKYAWGRNYELLDVKPVQIKVLTWIFICKYGRQNFAKIHWVDKIILCDQTPKFGTELLSCGGNYPPFIRELHRLEHNSLGLSPENVYQIPLPRNQSSEEPAYFIRLYVA